MGVLKQSYRRQLLRACLLNLPLRLKSVPVFKAAQILQKLGGGHSNATFWWEGHDGESHGWTLAKLAKTKAARWPAKNIRPVSFIGGPPGAACFLKGSVLTFLIDKILRDMVRNGGVTLDKIDYANEIYT